MTSELQAISFDATEPLALARFWAGVLGWEVVDDPRDGVQVLPAADGAYRLRFLPGRETKTSQNLLHFDLPSQSPDDQQQIVERALELGGRHVDVGQKPEEGHIVLGDPDGNEFCVVEPGNNFLAGCGVVGAVSCDGTPAVGHFWSEALGWPLVWDQGEETAIQSPRGGTKISWGGPPYMPHPPRNPLHLDLVPDDQPAEIDRLVALGARRLGDAGGGTVELADPDGNLFRLLP